VLVFPDQKLSAEQHLAFARRSGPHETSIGVYRSDASLRVRPELADASNLDHRGEVWGRNARLRMFQLGNRLWHTDSSFKRTPALASLLYARSIAPVGGLTEFADYTHRWRVNDVLMWDNRCTMHRGTAFDDLRWRRDVQRATVSDVANTCEQEGLAAAA